MVLSRTKQKVQKSNSALGIEYITSRHPAVKTLVALCKGQLTEPKYHWFYRLFIKPHVYGVPSSVEGVINKLRSAYWIEDDDLIQQIRYICWRLKFRTKPAILVLEPLARNLRDYLLQDQRIFSRQTSWETEYRNFQNEIIELKPELGLNIVFTPDLLRNTDLPLMDRYLLYLYVVADLNQKELCDLLNVSKPQLQRYISGMKENLNGIHKSTRTSRS